MESMCEQFTVTEAKAKQCMSRFQKALEDTLADPSIQRSSTMCDITYIQELPNGREMGKFLGIDFMGVYYRITVVNFSHKSYDMLAKMYAIPPNVLTGGGRQMFEHIACSLSNFVEDHGIQDVFLPLGMTFNFPVKRHKLSVAILENWGQNFHCTGVIGCDVVDLLQTAIEKMALKIKVVAAIHSTTGTLLYGAWRRNHCRMGLIIGINNDLAYVEKTSNLTSSKLGDSPYTVVRVQCKTFGDDGALEFLRTEFDKDVDNHSMNPGKEIFDKMVSGLYLGEIVRCVLAKGISQNLLFRGKSCDVLQRRGTFHTKYISEMEYEKAGCYNNVHAILRELDVSSVSEQDCAYVRHVCAAVMVRAFTLAAAVTASVINKMALKTVQVAVDGTMYRYHPGAHGLLLTTLTKYLKRDIQCDIVYCSDGAGMGAALAATLGVDGGVLYRHSTTEYLMPPHMATPKDDAVSLPMSLVEAPASASEMEADSLFQYIYEVQSYDAKDT